VAFELRGFPVSITIHNDEPPEERADNWIRDFEKWERDCVEGAGKKVLHFEEGRLRIDWGAYFLVKYDQAKKDQILRDIGIFSFSPVNNWEIVGSGNLNLNQWSSSGNVFYFTREEDVIEYARLKCGRAMYSWHIQQIARIMPGYRR